MPESLGPVHAAVRALDPTVQPVHQSFYVFLFMAVLLGLLLFSMVRHIRRARENLPRETPGEPALPVAEPGAELDAEQPHAGESA